MDVRTALDAIAADASKLGSMQYANFFVRLDKREGLLRWTMLAALGGLILLGASVLGNTCIFITRVANPLDRVSGYAESIAAGLDPEPLQLRHRDELAGMFASLQRMKDTLFSRIGELKEVEMWARKSRQQAIQARSQALTSLELAQRASHVQDDFLRRISHEIRTPLNAIIGMSYLTLQSGLSGAQRDYLSQINKSGSVLLDISTDPSNEALLRNYAPPTASPTYMGTNGAFIVEAVRGTPLLVQILILFYVVANAFGFDNRYAVGVLALSLFSGAYLAEMVRAGIESVRDSQLESARAIGLSRAQTYRYVILPQVVRQLLPPLAGQFASIIKDSSLLSIIAVSEFTLNAQEVNAFTYSTLESYLPLAAGYLLLTLPISLMSRALEKRYHYAA